MKPLILTALMLSACANQPPQYNVVNATGDSIKHGFTAIRVGAGLLIGSGTLIELNTPLGTLKLGQFQNRPIEPQPAIK